MTCVTTRDRAVTLDRALTEGHERVNGPDTTKGHIDVCSPCYNQSRVNVYGTGELARLLTGCTGRVSGDIGVL